MRALVSRGLLLPPLMCAALVCTPVGTAAALVDAGHDAWGRDAAGVAVAPEPDADDFMAQLDALDAQIDAYMAKQEAELDALLAKLDADGDKLMTQLDTLDRMDQNDVLAPLLGELTTLAQLKGDRLEPAVAARHAKAVTEAHTTVRERLRKMNATAPVTPHRAPAAADPVGDVLDSLQSAVDGLLKALTSLDLSAVLGVVTGLLSPVLGTVTGLLSPVLGLVGGLLGGGAPSVPALATPNTAPNLVPNPLPAT